MPAAKPRFIEPMILSEVQELPEGGEWAYEAKLDGYRCLAGKNGGVTPTVALCVGEKTTLSENPYGL